jgi:hypothetical protein
MSALYNTSSYLLHTYAAPMYTTHTPLPLHSTVTVEHESTITNPAVRESTLRGGLAVTWLPYGQYYQP